MIVVWGRAFQKASFTKKLERVKRAALIGISGALWTTPTIALKAQEAVCIGPIFVYKVMVDSNYF